MLTESITSSKTYVANGDGQFVKLTPKGATEIIGSVTVTYVTGGGYTRNLRETRKTESFSADHGDTVAVTLTQGTLQVKTTCDDAKWSDSAGTTLVKPSGGTVDPADTDAATEGAQGLVELATQSEVTTGTDAGRVVTPATLAGGPPAFATALTVQSGVTTTGAILHLNTKETSTVVNDVLGRINFKAPLDAAGTDAILVAGSIAAVAEDTFSASVNKTSLLFQTGASETATTKMALKSDGKLGIGTTAPVSITEIQDGLTTTGAILTLGTKEPTTVANDVLGRVNFYAPLDSAGTDANLVAGSIVAQAEDTFSASVNKTSLHFQTGASETATTKMTVMSSGNVGIGTTSPGSLTEIQGGLTTTGAVLTLGTKEPTTVVNDVLGRVNFYAPLDSAGTDANLVAGSIVARAEDTFSATVNKTSLLFQTGASEVATTKMTILSSGKVGVGTETPVSSAEIQDGLTTVGAVLTLGTKEPTTVVSDVLGRINFYAPLDTAGTDANLVAGSIAAVAEDTFSATVNATSLQFQTGASEVATTKMTVMSSGNVGIGTTAPASITEIQGGLTTTGAVLTLGTKETSTVANDVLGRVNFYAPLDAAGTDANLVAGSIAAVAEDTFSATVNATSLVFQTGASETATTKMALTSAGAIQQLATTNGPVGTFTCANNTLTTVPNTSVTANSIIQIFPTNAGAASLMAGASSLYISARTASTSFGVSTADAGAAAGTETFNYIILN